MSSQINDVNIYDPLKDGLSSVELVAFTMLNDYNGGLDGDLLTVNAARSSFGKEHAEFDEVADAKLIDFLARENHSIPFAHAHATLRLRAPMFVARQLGKHQVGFSWSEESRRYIKTVPEFYIPEHFREVAKNVKQGSADTRHQESNFFKNRVDEISHVACDLYLDMLDLGVCPEQARMVLPQNTYVTWVWTGSLLGWSRVYNLRIDPHSQKETQEYANAIGEIMSNLYPYAWEALTKQ